MYRTNPLGPATRPQKEVTLIVSTQIPHDDSNFNMDWREVKKKCHDVSQKATKHKDELSQARHFYVVDETNKKAATQRDTEKGPHERRRRAPQRTLTRRSA